MKDKRAEVKMSSSTRLKLDYVSATPYMSSNTFDNCSVNNLVTICHSNIDKTTPRKTLNSSAKATFESL